MRRECRERFPPPPRFSDPDMHHGTCVTHVPWCMSGSLTSSILWNRWRGKRSRHSRRMRNPRFWVSGKRHKKSKRKPMDKHIDFRQHYVGKRKVNHHTVIVRPILSLNRTAWRQLGIIRVYSRCSCELLHIYAHLLYKYQQMHLNQLATFNTHMVVGKTP